MSSDDIFRHLSSEPSFVISDDFLNENKNEIKRLKLTSIADEDAHKPLILPTSSSLNFSDPKYLIDSGSSLSHQPPHHSSENTSLSSLILVEKDSCGPLDSSGLNEEILDHQNALIEEPSKTPEYESEQNCIQSDLLNLLSSDQLSEGNWLLSDTDTHNDPIDAGRQKLLFSIRDIFNGIADQLSQGQTPCVVFNCLANKKREVQYDSQRNKNQFTIVVRLLQIIRGLLIQNVYATKRDIYYRDVATFGRQDAVDRMIDTFADHFQVTRYEMHVVRFVFNTHV